MPNPENHLPKTAQRPSQGVVPKAAKGTQPAKLGSMIKTLSMQKYKVDQRQIDEALMNREVGENGFGGLREL